MLFDGAYDSVILPILYVSSMVSGYMLCSLTTHRKITEMEFCIETRDVIISQLSDQIRSLENCIDEKNNVIEQSIALLSRTKNDCPSDSDE